MIEASGAKRVTDGGLQWRRRKRQVAVHNDCHTKFPLINYDAFDQALVEDRVNAVFDPGAVGGEHGAFGGALAHEAGLVVGNPDIGEITGAQKLGESEGIDLVGFDFGRRDGFGAQGVADDQRVDQRAEDGGDGPGVGGGFDGDADVIGEMGFGEGFERLTGGGETGAMEDVALLVNEGGFDFFFVEIQTGKCHNSVTPECRPAADHGRAV